MTKGYAAGREFWMRVRIRSARGEQTALNVLGSLGHSIWPAQIAPSICIRMKRGDLLSLSGEI